MLPMEDKLLDLYARLARSSSRSKLFAMRAKKDGRPALAKLFLALAESQAMQAQRFLMQIRGSVKTTDVNEQAVFSSELVRAIEEYSELMAEAEEIGNKALSTGFRHSGNVDKIILTLYKNLNEQNTERDYYVCDFCGYVAKDTPPDNCPICTAPKRRFKKVEAE